jgi:hypothetical protein
MRKHLTKIKKIILLIVLVYSCQYSIAQNNTETSRIYETTSNIAAYPCNVLGDNDTTASKLKKFSIAPYRARFAVIRTVTDSNHSNWAVIRFLDWTDSVRDSTSRSHAHEFNFYSKKVSASIYDSLTANYTPHISSDTTIKVSRYFKIMKSDLDSNCRMIFQTGIKSGTFTVGLVTMPLKLRLGSNFDFQGNFSLGTTAGARMRISKYNSNYIDLLLGLSISTVSLDSFSTNGKISGQPLTNIATFSPSLGVVLEFGKSQFGVFYGWDLLSKSTQSKYNWIYNGKPWISVGFGFSIFSVTSQQSANTNMTN